MKRFALAAALAFAAVPALAQPAREHRQMVAELGGTYVGPQAAYVQRVGDRMAKAAGLRQACVFTVVDSEVVNAFTAPPGCYVYVTRGLLAIVNSEAELAAVLGHELGHVAANHAIRQQNTETLGNLAAALVGVATKSDVAGKLAGRVAKLGALGYSRGQEYEADTLALRYLPAAGYAPDGLTNVLDGLQREAAFTAAAAGQPDSAMAPWASTHPLTSDRIKRARTQALQSSPGPDLVLDTTSYLAAIDGLPYGDDPAQGYVQGTTYIHPQLGVRFDAPRGFRVTNELEAVKIAGPGGAIAEFAGGRATARQLEGYAEQRLVDVVRKGRYEAGQIQRTRINGLDAVVLPARAASGGRPVDLTVVAYGLGGDEAYSFIAMTPAGQAALFDQMFDSFRRLSDREADAAAGRRIAVVDVPPGETVESLTARMAPDADPVGRFRMLNALAAGEPLRPGSRVKLIVSGRR